jgi:hypothetical protein
MIRALIHFCIVCCTAIAAAQEAALPAKEKFHLFLGLPAAVRGYLSQRTFQSADFATHHLAIAEEGRPACRIQAGGLRDRSI